MVSRYTVLLNQLLSELITCWQRPHPEKLLIESAFLITQKHCDSLRITCCTHKFGCDKEEIHFFKTIHPQFGGRMMYYSMVYESVFSCPPCDDAARAFWTKELERYERFCRRYVSVVEYLDQNYNNSDERYFLRRTGKRIVYVHEKAAFMCSEETTVWSTSAALCFAEKSYQQFVLSKLAFDTEK